MKEGEPRKPPGWQAYLDYGALFRPWLSGAPAGDDRPLRQADVSHLLELTESHATGSSLAWALQRRDLAQDLRAFVELTLVYARSKAEQRRRGIDLLVDALNRIGVEPLLLKGSAAQIGGIYPDEGFRLMTDVDLLVPPDRFAESVAAAERCGFKTLNDRDYGHTHAPQRHDELGILLEVHRQVTRVHERDNFPAQALFATATRHSLGAGQVLLPDWTSHAAMVILHALAWDRMRHMGLVPLKALLDLAALKASGVELDWEGVRYKLELAGELESLVHMELLFRALFEMPLSGIDIGPARAQRVLKHYRRGAEKPRLVSLARLGSQLRNRVKSLAHDPRRIGKLASLGFYVRLAGDLRRALR